MIVDFYDPEFDDLKIPARIRRRFDVTGKRVVVSGICSKCRGVE
jgi:Fe2+ or Zn2+ uptake regulation protein